MEENSKYLDSIAGKTAQLTANFEALSTAFLDSEFVKGVVDVGSGILSTITSITEKLGSIPTLVTAIVTAVALFKKDAGRPSMVNMPSPLKIA